MYSKKLKKKVDFEKTSCLWIKSKAVGIMNTQMYVFYFYLNAMQYWNLFIMTTWSFNQINISSREVKE